MPNAPEQYGHDLILISACLAGEPVRHDGRHAQCDHQVLQRWRDEGRIRTICPALSGGLITPRPKIEIEPGQDGAAVLVRLASVRDKTGRDYARHLVAGAAAAVRFAISEGIRIAVLKDGSASCGSQFIFSGRFDGVRISREGVTAAALRQAGLYVFSEHQIADADRQLELLIARERRRPSSPESQRHDTVAGPTPAKRL